MPINTRAAYIYDENLVLQSQGSLTLDSETGIYAFSEEEAQIQQGEVGTVQVVIILPNGTLTTGTPLISFRTKEGYGSSLLQMSTAENWQITVDETTNTYQTLYITMSVVGWTYHAGRHALQAVWLYTNGTLEKIPMVFYTVQNGVDNFEELTADTYEEIATSFQSVYADLLDRTSDIETFLLNGLNYTNGKTVLDQITLYNEDGNAVLTFNGTNFILNRGSGSEIVLTNVNNLADLANYIETNLATNDIIIFNGTNYVNITKTAFLSAINARVDNADSNILLRELLSNKVTSIGSSATDDQYVSAKAIYEKFLTKVDKEQINDLFKNVSYAPSTGILTFTQYNDKTVTIDLPLELIIESGYYDAANNDIVLVLANAGEIKIPAGDLLTDLDADNIRYDNTDSGLTATDVKTAIDELKSEMTTTQADIVEINAEQNRIYAYKHIRKLGTKIYGGTQPICLTVLGDSTGNDITEWVYLMTQWLAEKIDNYSIKYRIWDDTFQNYLQPTYLFEPTVGNGYVELDGIVGSYITTPDNNAFDLTGDCEIIAHVALDTYALTTSTIISKFGNAGQRSWAVQLTNKQIAFWWSSDGTVNVYKKSSIPLTIDDGDDIWIKVIFDADNDAGGNTLKFYFSADGISWIQLGTDVVTAGVTTIFNSSSNVEIGSRTGGTSELLNGKVYEVIVRNENGKVVCSPDFGNIQFNGTTVKDVENNTWTLNGTTVIGGSKTLTVLNASKGGATIAYHSDVTRFALETPLEIDLAFINLGHNQGSVTDIETSYKALISQILTKYSNAGIICISQNPQRTPEVNIIPHAIRCEQISQIANVNDYGFIDIYRLFNSVSDLSLYMIDGCHPNTNGSILWKNEVINYIKSAVLQNDNE